MSTLIWRNSLMPRDPHNDHPCRIIRELTRAEVDAEVGPMYRIEFYDGTQRDAFADELIIPARGRMPTMPLDFHWPPLPVSDLVLMAVAKRTGRTYSTVRALASTVSPWIAFVNFVRICEQEGHR